MSTRMRSPNFPGISLDKAVAAAAQIFDKNRQATIMREDAARDIGYTGLTGRSLKIMGALNQYDLIENVSKGQVRVTNTARDILHGFPEDVRLAALHTAGNAPDLFNAIYERFDGDIPGENAVRSFLIQKGFTNQGVEKALEAFLATNRYLEIKGASESHRSAPQDAAELPPVQQTQEAPEMQAEGIATGKPDLGTPRLFVGGELDFNLTKSGLSLVGMTQNRSELLAFIEKLKALAVLLPEHHAAEQDED